MEGLGRGAVRGTSFSEICALTLFDGAVEENHRPQHTTKKESRVTETMKNRTADNDISHDNKKTHKDPGVQTMNKWRGER